MTRVPENLLAVRRLLLDHLNVDEDRNRAQDLEPAEVGIVGDPAHRGGYHCGEDRVLTRDYSVVESSRDSAGLTLDAAALDVGLFEVRVDGRTHDLHSFSTWCVAQCAAGTPDSRDIREIIYSPDGKVVRRWDRLRKRTSGDSSHLWHTHFSFFRDSIKAKRDQTPLFRRYLTTIGLLEDEMTPAEMLTAKIRNPITGKDATVAQFFQSINTEAHRARLTAEAALAAVRGVDDEGIKALIREATTAEAQRDAELPARVLAALPAGGGPVSRDDLEAALRTVLGSVDNDQQG